MPTSLENPEIACQTCGQTVVLEGVPTNDRLPQQSQVDWIADQWDQVTPELVKLGWSVRRNEVWIILKNEVGAVVSEQKIRNRRHALCPTCSVKSPAHNSPLSEFSPRPKCVMCGHRMAAVKFCDGRNGRCLTGARNHIHRTCNKCGYQWIEAPRHERASAAETGNRDTQADRHPEQDHGVAGGVEIPQTAPAVLGGEVGQA